MRSMLAAILAFEAIILGLAILVAIPMSQLSTAVVAGGGGGIAVACLVTAGLVRYPVGVVIGSLLQIVCILCGLVVPAMYALGFVFAAMWGAALYYDRRVRAIQAARENPE